MGGGGGGGGRGIVWRIIAGGICGGRKDSMAVQRVRRGPD